MNDNFVQNEDQFARLSLGRVLGYSSGGFAGCCIYLFTLSYISWFWTDFAGLPIAYVGVIMLVSKLFDGVTDIIMGIIVDHTKSKHGKSRVWLLRMCVPFSVLGVLCFVVPETTTMGKVIYGGVIYTLMISFAYTALCVPYDSLISRITRNEYSQRQASMWRMLTANIAQIIANVATLPLLTHFGYSVAGFRKVAIIFAVITLIAYLICFFTTKEIVTSVNDNSQSIGLKGLGSQLKALFKNKYWVLAALMNLLFAANTGVAAIYIYYYQYVMGDQNLFAKFTYAQLVPGCILMIFLPKLLSKAKSITKTVAIFMFINAVLFFIQWLDPANVTKGFILQCLRSFCWVPFTGSIYGFLGQAVEYGEWKFGNRNEGLAFSASSFTFKVGSAAASGVLSLIMAKAGYDGTLAVQSESALRAINNCVNLSEVLVCLGVVVLLLFFNLEKIMPTVRAELQAKRENA